MSQASCIFGSMCVTAYEQHVAHVALQRLAQRGVVVFTGFQYVLAPEAHCAAYAIQNAWRMRAP